MITLVVVLSGLACVLAVQGIVLMLKGCNQETWSEDDILRILRPVTVGGLAVVSACFLAVGQHAFASFRIGFLLMGGLGTLVTLLAGMLWQRSANFEARAEKARNESNDQA